MDWLKWWEVWQVQSDYTWVCQLLRTCWVLCSRCRIGVRSMCREVVNWLSSGFMAIVTVRSWGFGLCSGICGLVCCLWAKCWCLTCTMSFWRGGFCGHIFSRPILSGWGFASGWWCSVLFVFVVGSGFLLWSKTSSDVRVCLCRFVSRGCTMRLIKAFRMGLQWFCGLLKCCIGEKVFHWGFGYDYFDCGCYLGWP